jgi:N-acyl-D-amino-acid deacylase
MQHDEKNGGQVIKKKGIDRRDFMKKTAVGAVGAGIFLNQSPWLKSQGHNNPRFRKKSNCRAGENIVFDVVIKNGRVIDGCGNPWFEADVALKNGRILKIGKVKSASDKVIDAEGLIVAPGIIDLHNHSDTEIFVNQKAESAIRQGITTMIVGNCGSSAAPQTKKTENMDWQTYEEYLNKLEKHGTAVNFGGFVGHGRIRRVVMGMEARPATEHEIERMIALLKESLEGGAFGLSTGLEYAPGANATTEELIELAKVLKDYPGTIYVTHMRQRDEMAVEAVQEGIEIGEKAGVPVHFSHHPMRYPFHGRMNELLKLKEEARDRGVDVTFDTMILNYNMSSMGALLPHWMHEGGAEKLVERLKDPQIRKQAKEYQNPQQKHFRDGLWDKVLLGNNRANKDLIGKNLAEIAEIKGYQDPWEMAMDMMIEEGDGSVGIYCNTFTDEDIITCLRHPLGMAVGSDVTAYAPYGPLGERRPHPANYGFYPLFFKKFIREMKVLNLEEAVRKVTSFPAQRIGLWDRGILREGMWGDIMVFDFDRIRDRSTFENPHQYPEGIEYVVVNGQLVIERGKHTGVLLGKVLRYPLS